MHQKVMFSSFVPFLQAVDLKLTFSSPPSRFSQTLVCENKCKCQFFSGVFLHSKRSLQIKPCLKQRLRLISFQCFMRAANQKA